MLKENRKCTAEFQLEGKFIFFATGNFNKFNEARRVLAEHNVAVAMLRVKNYEIQSDHLDEIAEASAIDAFNTCHLPVIVEDAGLFVEALKGFPGPYAAFVYKTISNPGLLKLMESIENRKASFRSAIAYCDGLRAPVIFNGEAQGKIAFDERWGKGKSGFGFDPIFIPFGTEKTFAEMEIEEKNDFSHRANAFHKFGKWYNRLVESRTH